MSQCRLNFPKSDCFRGSVSWLQLQAKASPTPPLKKKPQARQPKKIQTNQKACKYATAPEIEERMNNLAKLTARKAGGAPEFAQSAVRRKLDSHLDEGIGIGPLLCLQYMHRNKEKHPSHSTGSAFAKKKNLKQRPVKTSRKLLDY